MDKKQLRNTLSLTEFGITQVWTFVTQRDVVYHLLP